MVTYMDDVRESLDALKQGEIDEQEVRDRHGDVDGIERSIAVAVATRHRSMSFEELDEKVTMDSEGLNS